MDAPRQENFREFVAQRSPALLRTATLLSGGDRHAGEDLLQNALTLDGTLTANRQNEASAEQNEQVKKISSWAAIFFAPSFVAGIYGMNFDHMPELHWAYGYPMSIALMAGTAGLMYVIFKRKGWL